MKSLAKKIGGPAVAFLLLVACIQMVIGNASQPPVSKTGAPNENKCNQCHQGTAGTGSVSMIFGNNETQYIPGQVYTISVNVTDATKTRFGFQVTALAGGVGASVGTFAVTNSTNTVLRTGTVTGFSRKYMCHKTANGTQNWTFNWTAPPTDIGPITFFLVGVGANNNNNDTGDKVYSTTFNITATPPPPPIAAFSANDTNICVGTAVSFNDQSANSPSSYSWVFPGGTPSNSTAANPVVIYSAAGSYDVSLIVTNVSGSDTIVMPNHIVVNDLPVLSALPNSTSCSDGNDGSINLSVTGAAPQTFAWSNGSTAEDPSGLVAGDYTVTVTDANGCTSTGTYTINQPTAISLAFNSQPANCGQSNGNVTVTPSGGVGGYTYLWSSGATTATASGLAAGSYDVTVTDANGCQMIGTAALSNSNAPTGTTLSTAPTCNGDSDGSVDLTVSGGLAPLSFQWSNGSTTEDISGLGAGTYSVTVTSADGCILTQVVTLNEPALLSTTVGSTPEMLGLDGTATVTPAGGNGGYAYLWSNGQTTQTATGLAAGTYTVTVTDSLGCNTTASVNVSLVISVASNIHRDPFTVGPNPFEDYILLTPTVTTYGRFVVHLIDVQGRIVYAAQVDAKGSAPVRIETGSIPGGIYFLKLHTAKGDMTKKLFHPAR
ncbi:MAG: choice-of-anchor V domain-containing protein [Bacteroidia bacterium]